MSSLQRQWKTSKCQRQKPARSTGDSGINLTILDMIAETNSVDRFSKKSDNTKSASSSSSSASLFRSDPVTGDENKEELIEIVMPSSLRNEFLDRQSDKPHFESALQELSKSSPQADGTEGSDIKNDSSPLTRLLERDDSDSISQITSSIASHSFYDSTALYPSARGFARKPKRRASMGGDVSVADTLEQIAQVIQPDRHLKSHHLRNQHKRESRSSSSQAERISSIDELSQAESVSWKSVKNNVDSAISKTRLFVRYLESRFFPNCRVKVEKNGEEDGNKDYYGILMSSSESSGNKLRRIKKQKTWKILLRVVLGLFTLRIIRAGITMIQNSRGQPAGFASGASRRLVRGGMAYRDQGTYDMEDAAETKKQLDAIPPAHPAPKGGVSDPLVMLDESHVGLPLPDIFDSLSDINTPRQASDVPFFWHIPRTGGATVNDVLTSCMKLTLASNAGGPGHENDSELKALTLGEQSSYVNVNTSTKEGIVRARGLGLASSGLADAVVSSHLYPAAGIFTPENQGRMFALFRDPVERAESLFHFLQDTQWRPAGRQDLSSISMEDYFKTGVAENNWMTRFLINEHTKGELTDEDLKLAKEVLRRKCLVGLLAEKGESFDRFEKFFGWKLKGEGDADAECHEKKLHWAWPLKHKHEHVEEGSPLWKLIVEHNKYDIQLYKYAQVLYQQQEVLFQ